MPACSRCNRLGIVCVGSGEQRYKFLDQTHALARPTGGPAARDHGGVPSTPLSNDLSTLTGSLVSAITVTDPRFDLTVYGYFFEEVPRRLGRNSALDASVRALTVAFPSLRTRQQSADVFRSYSNALRCLRDCLGDPSLAQSPDTLCAVYLVMICQVRHFRRSPAANPPPLSRLEDQTDHALRVHIRAGLAAATISSQATARQWPTCLTLLRRRTGMARSKRA